MAKHIEKKGLIAQKPDYAVAIKYSDKAIKENLIKFIPRGDKPFEIPLHELVHLLARHMNSDLLVPAIINNNVIRMIRVKRNLTLVPNRDIMAGETVNNPFNQMMPIEFAIAEEALGLAIVDDNVKVVNKKEYDAAKLRVNDSVMDFAKEQNEALLKKLKSESEASDQNTS